MKFEDNYSLGCKACQNGKWLCIYLTYMCNASCAFCPAPFRNRDFVQSAFGNEPSVVLKYLERFAFEGLSFSGGECFLVFDRMLAWLKLFNKWKPELYYWAYTNGRNIQRNQMEELRRYGLNELRFNIAATGYNDPSVMKTITYATRIFDHVAVEIPSIPEDFEQLKVIIPVLEDSGVDYLNLHEYILVPGDPNTKKAPKSLFLMNFEMKIDFHLTSYANTEKIRDLCCINSWNIKVNNCSLNKKENQMLGRRLTMGAILKEDHEKLTDDGFLETVYFPGKDVENIQESLNNYHLINRSYFIHPDQYENDKTDVYLLKILPRLGIVDFPKVFNFIKI
jgi:pyruvate formate-lyase activating enzyme-like uncharacterized protein